MSYAMSDGKMWLLIGMLADLSDDCMTFVRALDAQALNPITLIRALTDFRGRIRREYIDGRMWLRHHGTYTRRVIDMLRDTRMVDLKEEMVVIRMPGAADTRMLEARVCSVARGILAYLEGEFPRQSLQSRLVCFLLDEGGVRPVPRKIRDLCDALILLRWEPDKRTACAAEVLKAWPLAVEKRHNDSQASEYDVWLGLASERTARGKLRWKLLYKL